MSLASIKMDDNFVTVGTVRNLRPVCQTKQSSVTNKLSCTKISDHVGTAGTVSTLFARPSKY